MTHFTCSLSEANRSARPMLWYMTRFMAFRLAKLLSCTRSEPFGLQWKWTFAFSAFSSAQNADGAFWWEHVLVWPNRPNPEKTRWMGLNRNIPMRFTSSIEDRAWERVEWHTVALSLPIKRKEDKATSSYLLTQSISLFALIFKDSQTDHTIALIWSCFFQFVFIFFFENANRR